MNISSLGEVTPSEKMAPNSGKFVVEKSGGHVANSFLLEHEQRAISFGRTAELHYWMAFKWRGKEITEADIAEQDVVDDDANLSDRLEQSAERDNLQLFECPTESCSASFSSFEKLQAHITIGKHRKVPEKVSLRDYALGLFIDRIESIDNSRAPVFNIDTEHDIQSTYNDQTDDLPIGWALRSKRQSARFSTDVKNYLTALYEEGEQSRTHYDPKEVPNMMAAATHQDGSRRFLPNERLNWRQVTSKYYTGQINLNQD